ncbi:MAG: M23 family metallopeptidase [Bdellovibrionales bacterium]|nr:M23 family metallopeptidase [Bdellovibrionales bacterium]
MDRKTYTLIIASNRRGATVSFTVSSSWLKAAIILSFTFLVIFTAAAVDYFGLLQSENQNKIFKAENEHLKRQFQVVESKLSSLESNLDRVQNFTKKLKVITNVEDESRPLHLAMGTIAKPGQDLGEEENIKMDRQPSSEFFLAKEAPFSEKLPLDEQGGELSRDDQRNYASLSVRIDRAIQQTQLREQGVLQLWESLSERQSLINATPNIKPARGWYTSRFGYRVDPFNGRPEMHAGLDIAAPPGTPVYAPADGVVSYVGFEPGYGKIVSIDHGYGVVTRFAHNSRVVTEQGKKVSRRDIIAAVGTTGRSSGPHVHYEVRVNGIPVDPQNYILDDE